MDLIKHIESTHLKTGIPEFSTGDTIQVHLRIREGEKERIQIFEGVVIARQGGGTSESFTIRKRSFGIGVEKIIPLHSPSVSEIKIVKRGTARRAKLYYFRNLTSKEARLATLERRRVFSDSQISDTASTKAPVAEKPSSDDSTVEAASSEPVADKENASSEVPTKPTDAPVTEKEES